MEQVFRSLKEAREFREKERQGTLQEPAREVKPMSQLEQEFRENSMPTPKIVEDSTRVVVFDEPAKVGVKQIDANKFAALKKALLIAVTTGLITVTSIVGADIINHPEYHATTHPNYEGPTTFMEEVERFPENVKDIADDFTSGRGAK